MTEEFTGVIHSSGVETSEKWNSLFDAYKIMTELVDRDDLYLDEMRSNPIMIDDGALNAMYLTI